MTTSRVSTSARAIMTRAATQAAEPVMWGAMLRFDGACGDEVRRQLHAAARVPGGAGAGLRAPRRLELHPHARPGARE